MSMFRRLPNPDWLADVQAIFTSTQAKTEFGCGGCAHAEWVGFETETNSSGLRLCFEVAICRSGIPIANGEPRKYCTAFQKCATGMQANAQKTPQSGTPPLARLHFPK